MLSKDLPLRPALNPLGPGIPTHDPPLRVEHEYGVVLDPFDEHTELLFAVAQGLFDQDPLAILYSGQLPKTYF